MGYIDAAEAGKLGVAHRITEGEIAETVQDAVGSLEVGPEDLVLGGFSVIDTNDVADQEHVVPETGISPSDTGQFEVTRSQIEPPLMDGHFSAVGSQTEHLPDTSAPKRTTKITLSIDDERQLIAAAKSGNKVAFERLVRATHGEMYVWAFRLTRNEQDAEDIVQEAYIRAYKGLKHFRADAKFSSWIYRITTNVAKQQFSRKSRQLDKNTTQFGEDHQEAADTSPGADPIARFELAESLVEALRSLPIDKRAVIILRDMYDLTYEDIASRLGISVTAAKVRRTRALREIKDEITAKKLETLEGVSNKNVAKKSRGSKANNQDKQNPTRNKRPKALK